MGEVSGDGYLGGFWTILVDLASNDWLLRIQIVTPTEFV